MIRSLISFLLLVVIVNGTITTVTAVAQAKTLLVADVDDTIRVLHDKSLLKTLVNMLRENLLYPGLREQLWELIKVNPDTEVIYLTNAPSEFFRDIHLHLLQTNDFPPGVYIQRSLSNSSDDFKMKKILRFVKKSGADHVILIGDNVQRDPITYGVVTDILHHWKIQVKVYIHKLPFGRTPIRRDQTAYTVSNGVFQRGAFCSPLFVN